MEKPRDSMRNDIFLKLLSVDSSPLVTDTLHIFIAFIFTNDKFFEFPTIYIEWYILKEM